MNRIEAYVSGIVSGLPITAIEKEDLSRELFEHLEEHAAELLSEGLEQEEAIEKAIQTFGDKEMIHKDMYKALFPSYKFVRWFCSTITLSVALLFAGYSIMESFFPEYDNTTYFQIDYILLMIMVTGFICGFVEFIYEVSLMEYKAKWLYNPWLVFFTPALLWTGILTFNIYRNIDAYYQEKIDVISIGEMYVIPVSVIMYIIIRQLLTWLFISKKSVKT